MKWWKTYSKDTIKRIKEFEKLKTGTLHYCLSGDARTTDIISALSKKQKSFADILQAKNFRNILKSALCRSYRLP
ncbi:hypothetical protein AGMMS49953_01350 [Endomicrobiia bacterium]|nr:hypothetical protein AGMMS49953_01350 [Endomicrobiia bacterium]